VIIEKGNVVFIDYTLKNEEGVLLDSTKGLEPFGFIHGKGMIVPGLEHVLLGKTVNDKFTTVIPPEDGYGTKDDVLVETVPLNRFEDPDIVKIDTQFQLDKPNPLVATVTKIDDGQVTLSMRHRFAGETLYYDVEIIEVRDATEEELAQEQNNLRSSCVSGCSCC